MHIKLTNGQPHPYSIEQLRRDNPQVSFPSTIPDATLAAYNVFPLTPTTQPATDHTQRVTEGTPTLIGGVWTQTWVVTDLSEVDLAEVVANQWTRIRKDRNRLLADCDWTQLSDAPVDASVWQPYRQALRDITAQSDPFNITWPLEP
jgi:hypothetical protein